MKRTGQKFQKLNDHENDQNLSTTKNKPVLFAFETELEKGMVTKITIIVINEHKIYHKLSLLKTSSTFFRIRVMYLELI